MIARSLDPLLSRWDALDDPARRQLTVVGLAGVLFLVHLAWYSAWYIEDAAISFAFSRHLAEGEGPVAYRGGEPVEGFSNPTWTLLLALLHLVGIHPWIGAKLLGAAFGLAGLPVAWAWARSVMGPRDDLFPALPVVLLALSPQYVLWAASGLENSVVTLTMAAGGALLLREVARPGGIPWSGLLWGLLAISRPEAPADAAIAGVVGLGALALRHGPGPMLGWAWRWGLLLLAPVVAWHLYAFLEFAWALPNTYFAKLGDGDRSRPWIWSGSRARSWGYLRGYALYHGHGFLLWLYALGLAGFRGARAGVALAAFAGVLVLLLPGIVWLHDVWGAAPLEGWIPALGADGALPTWPFAPDPAWWSQARIVGLGVFVAILPLVGLGRPGQAGRVLAAWLVGFTGLFALVAGGDWMDGYRWMNLCVVPLCILLSDASAGLWDRLAPRLGGRWRWATLVPVGVVALLSVIHAVDRIRGPETSPYGVARRVVYMSAWADRLDLPLYETTWMDVDMGAHVWWAGREAAIVDMAGLVDVPMGHHSWEKAFVAQYVFEERQPDFAHVHGSWARKTRMTTHAGWRAYLDLPDFPVSVWRTHEGNHVHRRHVFLEDWPHGEGRRVDFEGGLVLRGWRLPAPVVAPGGSVQIELGWSVRGGLGDPRVLVILSRGERRVVREVPLAYDLVPVRRWRWTEVARGDHRLTLPDDLPVGEWDLSIAVLDGGGAVAPERVPDGATTDEPAVIRGEVRWAGVLEVRPEPEVRKVADAALDAALATGDCDAGEARWDDVRHHLPPDHPWRKGATARARTGLARCHVDALEALLQDGDPIQGEARRRALHHGVRARTLDHRDGRVRDVTRRAARRLEAASRAAEAEGEVHEAYGLARDALRLDPSDAWGRRRAERLRDASLGLDLPSAPTDALVRWLGWG